MDRREGFGERDPHACDLGDISGCEIIPTPGLALDLFSYSWVGQGDGYDLRLTIHRGYAVGVLVGPSGRFEFHWDTLKELRTAYFHFNDSLPRNSGIATRPTVIKTQPTAELTDAAVQAATLARIEPTAPAGSNITEADILVLITEEARVNAGGDPSDCRDMAGAVGYVLHNVISINTAFSRSQIPARVGATVARYAAIHLFPTMGPTHTCLRI